MSSASEQAGETPAADSGLSCLATLLAFHQIPSDQAQLRHALGHGRPADDTDLVLLAKRMEAKARAVTLELEGLERAPLPAIGKDRSGDYFIIGAIRDGQVLIQRPGAAPTALALPEFEQMWSGRAILVTTRLSVAAQTKFDVTWFIPALVKYRWMLGDVLAASLALQLFALATPMIFQVVIDKVLVHQGLTTLDVLAIGLITVVVFESFLGGLRAYVFSHTTSRVDVELGAKLYRHLLNLPLAYFESRRVGDTIARVRELETIREFLTSSSVTLFVDLLFTVIHRNMRAIAKGRTVMIIAHRLSAIRMADRIITMENGEITEVGTHEALMAANGRYAQLWRTQMHGDPTGEPA